MVGEKNGYFSAFRDLRIKNFKSIRDMELSCNHINLFIGKPNVGKSNILEAIGLLGGCFSTHETNKFLSEFIRYESFGDLFYDVPGKDAIEVQTEMACALIQFNAWINNFNYVVADSKEIIKGLGDLNANSHAIKEMFYKIDHQASSKISPYYCTVRQDGQASDRTDFNKFNNPIRKYEFKSHQNFPHRFSGFLTPPYGSNLYSIVRESESLQSEIAELFLDYGLDFVIELKQTIFKLQKKKGRIVTSLNYSSMADTLQRFIFHLAAIESNSKAVILFEEPEAHSHPAYIRDFTERLINSKENQYFITTHSPFVLNILLEEKKIAQHLNVFKVNYKDHQTTATKLTQKEIGEYLDYGTDIFFKLLD